MHKRNVAALIVFALFYAGYGVYLTLFQERIIYQPWPQDFVACVALPTAERVVHNGTRMYVEHGERGIVILYHGNAGSACDRAFYAELFASAGYGYALVEYAGYSNDPRTTTHDLVKADVRNVIDHLDAEVYEGVIVVGESVGTGAASYHTTRMAPDHLILIAPFASLADVAKRKFWFYPTRFLVDDAFDNAALLHDYHGGVTILHGGEDRLISPESGKQLYDHLSTPHKQFVLVPERGHNDLFLSPTPGTVIGTVLREVAQESPSPM